MNTLKQAIGIIIGLILIGCQAPQVGQPPIAKPEGSAPAALQVVELSPTKILDRVAFSSCANQDQPQPLWATIQKTNPDLFLAMGDNVYASRPEQQPISAQYKKMDVIPEYREIRSKVPFMGIWDDHDYGVNDGGASWQGKEEARREFLNYWKYVANELSPGRQGVYHSKIFGSGHQRVQVILLDTRWNRSELVANPDKTNPLRRYLPNKDPKASLLGAEQWGWLESELRKKAEVRFLVSSIQMIANDHGFEKWGLFPHEKEKFYQLLKKTKAKNLVVLSGDRHIGTIAKHQISGWGTLFDITASSINRVANFEEIDESYVGKSFAGENFGLAKINWKNKKIEIEVQDIKGQVINSVTIPLK